MAPLVPSDADRLERVIWDAFLTAQTLDWRSYDPFDLLLSPVLSPLQGFSRGLARVAVQVGKRSGERLRTALRVEVHQEPKALADCLRAAVLLAVDRGSPAQDLAEPLTKRLLAAGELATGGYGWGLGFPYTSRFVNARTGTPNAYTTIAAIDALLDASVLIDEEALLQVVSRGCRFLVDELGVLEHNGRRWLRYWPGSDARVINIQASAAALFSRAGERLNDDRLSRRGEEAFQTTARSQRADGSWPYSDEGRASFVDGFHTGFVLQGLADYAAQHPPVRPEQTAAVSRGFRYFKDRLMASSDLPRGVADGEISLDPQNVAQCVQTLVICAEDDSDVGRAVRVWDGATECGKCPLDPSAGLLSLRWSLGPGVLAAAHLLRRIRMLAIGPAARRP